jgi:hypothetical protein
MELSVLSAAQRYAQVMLAGECERASDCKPQMPWSERGWAPTRANLEWAGTGLPGTDLPDRHCSFVTDGDSSTIALHAISADRRASHPFAIFGSGPRRAG